jgi:hypothetical protein
MMDAVHNPTDHRRVSFEDVDVDAVDATRVRASGVAVKDTSEDEGNGGSAEGVSMDAGCRCEM